MPSGRPAIPASLVRAVKVEAGHRCGIPTCRATSGLELHHIVDWSKVLVHEFENLILICAVCHARATSGEIDVKSMQIYKANLGLLTSRYGELERRVLDIFVRHPDKTEIPLDVSQIPLLQYLLDDGMLECRGPGPMALWFDPDDTYPRQPAAPSKPWPTDPTKFSGNAMWGLTDVGEALVNDLRTAREVL